jgi:hypothetical protein
MKKRIETFTAIILFFVLISASLRPATPKIASVIVPEPTSEVKTPLFFYKGIKITEVENHLARKLTLWEKISFGLNKKKTIEALNNEPQVKINIFSIAGILFGTGLLFNLIILPKASIGGIFIFFAVLAVLNGLMKISKRGEKSIEESVQIITTRKKIAFYLLKWTIAISLIWLFLYWVFSNAKWG